jgi:hypothetical protein
VRRFAARFVEEQYNDETHDSSAERGGGRPRDVLRFRAGKAQLRWEVGA